MDDWDSLRAPLDAVCEGPADEERIKRAVDAAELVASAAGEPPDELPDAAREWVERTACRRTTSSSSPSAR